MLRDAVPRIEAGADLFTESRPGGGEQAVGWIGECLSAVGCDLVCRPGEEMKFFAGVGCGDVEDAAHLLCFAIAPHAADPSLGRAGIGALVLDGSDEELGEFAVVAGFDNATFEPCEELDGGATGGRLKV